MKNNKSIDKNDGYQTELIDEIAKNYWAIQYQSWYAKLVTAFINSDKYVIMKLKQKIELKFILSSTMLRTIF